MERVPDDVQSAAEVEAMKAEQRSNPTVKRRQRRLSNREAARRLQEFRSSTDPVIQAMFAAYDDYVAKGGRPRTLDQINAEVADRRGTR